MKYFFALSMAILLFAAGNKLHAQKKLAIVGSSTSACLGPTVADSCYVGRLRAFFNKQLPADTIINNDFAVAGYSIYKGMPSSYVSPYSDPNLQPDPGHNITAALATHPDVVLINYPSNGYDTIPVSNIMFCFRSMRDAALQAGIPCYITTTQPRTSGNFATSAGKAKLALLKDSILAAFGTYAIDFYTGLFNAADSAIRYDAGDGTHMNNTGHDSLYRRILRKNIFSAITGNPGTGLQGAYFNNITFTGSPVVTRIDPTVNFDYVYTAAAPGVNLENYSVRWTGQVKPLYNETYTFYTVTDDGVRLWVNGIPLVNNWVNQGATEKSGSIVLAAGRQYDIVMEYYQGNGYASSKLLWSSPSTPKAVVPAAQLFPPNSTLPKPPACASNQSPLNGSSIATATSALLAWNNITEASSYNVYIWAGATAPSQPTATAAGNTFNVTGLLPGTNYSWYIVPVNAGGAATDCIYNKTSFTTADAVAGTGLQGAYYNNTTLAGSPVVTRIDPVINFNYVYTAAAPGVQLENYSVRWAGKVKPLYNETYTFYTVTDDGVRLWVNGQLLVNNWINQGATEKSGSISLAAGQQYDIVMEYYQGTGYASAQLLWSSASTAKAVIPAIQLYPPAAAARTAASSAIPVYLLTTPLQTPAPNPVKRGQPVYIWLSSETTCNVTIKIMNSQGSTVSTQNATLQAGINKTTINTSACIQGVYFMQVSGSNAPVTMKLLLLQ